MCLYPTMYIGRSAPSLYLSVPEGDEAAIPAGMAAVQRKGYCV